MLYEKLSKGHPGLQRDPCCPVCVERAPLMHSGGFGAGGAIPSGGRVLLLAVRTACYREQAAAQDRLEVTTLRAVRVRAAIL